MNIQDLISFSFIEGVGEKALKNLDSFSSYEDIAKLSDNELNKIFTNSKSINYFRKNFSLYIKKAYECLMKLKDTNSIIIKNTDKFYPKRLIDANKSPVFIYCIGNTSLLNHNTTAAISGPRKASLDGLRKAYSTAKTLCAEDTVVISGLALWH